MSMNRFLFSALGALLLSTPSYAAERLVFRDAPKDTREESVIAMLATDGAIKADIPYKIAAIDLNGDGVDEWIVNQKPSPDCETRARCTFAIAGLSGKQPVILGDIAARKITLSDDRTYGISRLNVYNNAQDDFASEIYVWRPEKRAFAP